MFQNLSQYSSPVNMSVAPDHCLWGIVKAIEYSSIDLCKMLNIFDAFFEIRNLVYVNREKSIQWNLPIDISLSLHEARCVRIWSS
mgnify:CR=1 FL=1